MQHITDPKAANVNIPAQTPSGRLYLSVPQLNIVDGSRVKVEFDTIGSGFVDGIEDVVNHRILPGITGWYYVNAFLELEGLVDECMYIIYLVNTGTPVRMAKYLSPCTKNSVSQHISLTISDVMKLTNIQYVEVEIEHLDPAHTCDIQGNSLASFLTVQRVR